MILDVVRLNIVGENLENHNHYPIFDKFLGKKTLYSYHQIYNKKNETNQSIQRDPNRRAISQ